MSEVPEDVERWTAGRRLALVTEILAGKLSVQEAARQHGLTVADVEEWKERALEGAKNALRSRPKDDEALRVEREKKLLAKIGELAMEVEVLKRGSEIIGRPSRNSERFSE